MWTRAAWQVGAYRYIEACTCTHAHTCTHMHTQPPTGTSNKELSSIDSRAYSGPGLRAQRCLCDTLTVFECRETGRRWA